MVVFHGSYTGSKIGDFWWWYEGVWNLCNEQSLIFLDVSFSATKNYLSDPLVPAWFDQTCLLSSSPNDFLHRSVQVKFIEAGVRENVFFQYITGSRCRISIVDIQIQGASLSYRQRNARSVWGIGPTRMVTATRRRTIPCWPRIFADHCRNWRVFQRLPGGFELSGEWLWTMGRLGWVAASWSWDVPSGNLTWLLKIAIYSGFSH